MSNNGGIATRAGVSILDTISDHGVIAVLRAPTAEWYARIAGTLVEQGVRTIEVTLTSEGALPELERLVAEYRDDDDVVIGAGTVLTADQAEACTEVGAQFLVSPVASPDVIASARLAGVTVIPGAMTPSEIFAARTSGADAVKVFPASALTPRFISDVHGPLPGIPLVPTGGVGLDDIEPWLSAGAAAVGLGGSLIGDTSNGTVDVDGLKRRARRAAEAVAMVRR